MTNNSSQLPTDAASASSSASLAHPGAPEGQDQPLGLTVHNIELPDQNATSNNRGRWKMMAVLLVCVAPVFASYFTYYVIRPEGRRNFGELINPQKPLPEIAVTALDGQRSMLPELRNQWLLISVSGGACETGCQQRLYFQRQLRESLGKEKVRLDRVWLVTDNAPVDDSLRPGLAGSTVLRIAPEELSSWLQPAQGQNLADHLYVVDPLGNWMMRFPANMDAASAAKAKRDLDRLLRASASWDKEGR